MIKKVLLFSLLLAAVLFNGCRKDDVDIDLFPDAGNDYIDIENDGYVVTLSAKPAGNGETGTWRIYMGENGRFDDIHDPHTNFYGEPGESYLLGWELSVGDTYKADEIYVSFKPLNPVVLIDVKDTIYNNVSLYLEAEAAKFGAVGTWELIEGINGRIENAGNHLAEFIGVEKSKYTVRWKLTYGSKEAYVDIPFYTDVLRADAGEDNLDITTFTDIDDPKYYNMNAFRPAGSTVQWELIQGGNGMVISQSDPHSVFEGRADTTYKIVWHVQVDNYTSTDTLKLRFRGKWGVWVDPRDKQEYRYARIGNLEWMVDNFNYATPWSEKGRNFYYGQSARALIYDGHAVDTEEDRKKYGRLYNYYSAIETMPEGWRLPTRSDFMDLESTLGGKFVYWDKLLVGGESGFELIFAGAGSYSSYWDMTLSDGFHGQDIDAIFVTSSFYDPLKEEVAFWNYNVNGYGRAFVTSTFYMLASVRYVREVQ